MNEWWTMQQGAWVSSIGGAGLGVLAGTFGATLGILAPKGIGKRVMVPLHIAFVVLGLAALGAGLVALMQGQPRHVYFPLLLLGGILSMVMGPLLPVTRLRYRQADGRRMEAESLRRG
jgi:hypothetical protein